MINSTSTQETKHTKVPVVVNHQPLKQQMISRNIGQRPFQSSSVSIERHFNDKAILFEHTGKSPTESQLSLSDMPKFNFVGKRRGANNTT